jgi:catechol 2,3-dioxygenase-like lactoylglutathione lyase family enzyme
MFEDIHHFGVTIRDRRACARFYAGTLRLPALAETVSSGPRADRVCGLDHALNRIVWHQIGDGGVETFYLPRHRSAPGYPGDIRRPGYRYIAFNVDGFEDYVGRLEAAGLKVKRAATACGKCALSKDPDGSNVLLFDTGKAAFPGRVSSLKEIGLVAGDPEGYEEFFDLLGLWRVESGCDFLGPLFGADAPAPLYGHVRLICLEGAALPVPPRHFPASSASAPAAPRERFCDAGVKHVAYSVSDIAAFHKRCAEAGVQFLFEPTPVSGGSVIAYFLDPEGNTFEAMQLNPAMRALAVAAGAARSAIMDFSVRVKDSLSFIPEPNRA